MNSETSETPRAGLSSNWKLLIAGAGVGLIYSVGLRLLAESRFRNVFEVMTFGFLVLTPFAMGCITVYFVEVRRAQGLWTWALLPWVPVAGGIAAAMLAFLEGWICVVMYAPLALVVSTIGGLAGGTAARYGRSRRGRNLTVACVMVLPVFSQLWEKPVLYHQDFRRVENTIDIQAPPAVIWKNIERVPAIRREELPDSWTRRIGFPDPIEATLSREGVGGVRNASFAGGVLFIETIDVWEPEQRLGFTIAAQSDQIPATTLDAHVKVGGPYFDVLHGEYRLEPLANGVMRLRLSSRQRLSTDFNWYAHLWTDAVMADLQSRILVVIRRRCERQPAP